MELNTVLCIASMTKLVTSIAAMQLIERNLIALDTDVTSLIPELSSQPILHGFDSSGNPQLSKREKPIKFVDLLTHSVGTTYEKMDPLIPRYRNHINDTTARSTMLQKSRFPLRFEPGTYWGYGTAIDWVGLIIERLTKQSLQSYFEDRIFAPLGIERVAFLPHMTDEMKKNTAGLTSRDEKTGGLKPASNPYHGETPCFGGHGLFADLSQYIKILHSLLVDDEKLLSKKSTAEMFRPHLTAEVKEAFREVRSTPLWKKAFVGDFPDSVGYDWGIGGVITDEDDKGTTKRRKGCMMWSGLPNCFWVCRSSTSFSLYSCSLLPLLISYFEGWTECCR